MRRPCFTARPGCHRFVSCTGTTFALQPGSRFRMQDLGHAPPEGSSVDCSSHPALEVPSAERPGRAAARPPARRYGSGARSDGPRSPGGPGGSCGKRARPSSARGERARHPGALPPVRHPRDPLAERGPCGSRYRGRTDDRLHPDRPGVSPRSPSPCSHDPNEVPPRNSAQGCAGDSSRGWHSSVLDASRGNHLDVRPHRSERSNPRRESWAFGRRERISPQRPVAEGPTTRASPGPNHFPRIPRTGARR